MSLKARSVDVISAICYQRKCRKLKCAWWGSNFKHFWLRICSLVRCTKYRVKYEWKSSDMDLPQCLWNRQSLVLLKTMLVPPWMHPLVLKEPLGIQSVSLRHTSCVTINKNRNINIHELTSDQTKTIFLRTCFHLKNDPW